MRCDEMKTNTRILLAALAVAALSAFQGCATWDCRFKPNMTMWFINDLNDVLKVDYGDEERTRTLYRDDGTEFPYKSRYKVRATFPSGYRFVAYDVPSNGGTLYRSDDGEWELLSAGYACRVYQFTGDESEMVFEGMIYSQSGGGMSKGNRKAGSKVYNSPREHGDRSRPDKKVTK